MSGKIDMARSATSREPSRNLDGIRVGHRIVLIRGGQFLGGTPKEGKPAAILPPSPLYSGERGDYYLPSD